MYSIKNENQEKCRTCLSTENIENNLDTRLIINYSHILLLEMLEICTSIQIDLNDGLPHFICNNCHESLNNAYNFREKALQTQITLQEQLLKTEDSHVDSKSIQCDSSNEPQLDTKTELQNNVGHPDLATQKEEITRIDEKSDVDNIEDPLMFIDETEKKIMEAQFDTAYKPSLQTVDPELVQFAIDEQKSRIMGQKVCSLCGYIAKSGGGLSKHILYIHKDVKDRWCRQCFKEIDETSLIEHKKWHTANPLFQCTFCPRMFYKFTLMREHMLNHSSHRPYMCQLCDTGFPVERNLQQHMRTHVGTKTKRFKCELCSAEFGFKLTLEKHVIMHGKFNKPTNQCPNEEDELDDGINEQLLTPGKSKGRGKRSKVEFDTVMCDVCGIFLTNLTRLNFHKRKHVEEAKFSCPDCSYKCHSKYDFESHRLKHTKEKPRVCHICGKSFAMTNTLNSHIKLHTGRPEQCKICKRRFCQKSQLNFHMRQHLGNLPYKCEYCNTKFMQMSHLKAHIIRKHTEDRPFSCVDCGQSFKTEQTLKTHSLTHKIDKPFHCSYCEYQCSTMFRLRKHTNSQHKGAKIGLKCPKCSEYFPNMSELRLHSENEHRIVVEQVRGEIVIRQMVL